MSKHNDKQEQHDHMEAWLGLYVLGGLTEEEERKLEAVLATRPDWQTQVEDLTTAVSQLPYATEAIPPSDQMTNQLMARVEKNAQARFGVGEATSFTAVSAPAPHPQRQIKIENELKQEREPAPEAKDETASWWTRLTNFWSHPGTTVFAVAVAVVLMLWAGLVTQQLNQVSEEMANLRNDFTAVQTTNSDLATANAALVTTNQELTSQNSNMLADMATLLNDNSEAQLTIAQLQGELNNSQQAQQEAETQLVSLQAQYDALQLTTADQQQVTDLLFSPQTYNISLPGTAETPDASGRLVLNPNQGEALLLVSGLPPLPEGQVYQVLLIYDTGHNTADTFRVDTTGDSVLLVHSDEPWGNFTAVGISIEPEGGSPQRTGDIIILGELAQS